MTVEIKHNQSFWEQGPQNAEEIHAVQQLQTGLYNIRSDTHIGITWEENERDAVFVLYMLEGEMQFQSSSEVFSLKKDDSALFSYEATAIHGISKTPCRLMLFSTIGSYQKVNATNACFEKLREVELKDIYTIGHSRRVSSLSMSIALQLDPGYDILTLGAAATFHDLGKYYTPIEILQKPGRLTPEEFSIIKLHPQASWQLLMESHGEIIAEIALQHMNEWMEADIPAVCTQMQSGWMHASLRLRMCLMPLRVNAPTTIPSAMNRLCLSWNRSGSCTIRMFCMHFIFW